MSRRSTFIKLPSAPMQTIYKTVQKIVQSNVPILITGETGVGKESIARYIHESGPRRNRPFVVVNCGRFSAECLQSELFGQKADAFTGATRQRKGMFEIADGGILLLDEILEMSWDAQKMLLRVLDTATFTPLGGNEAVPIDVQVIATTNRDIVEIVDEQKFREDLYYCFKGIKFHLPPLRERREDITPLVEAFMNEFSAEYGKSVTGITTEARNGLEQAAFPGNIRQLRSEIQTAVALATTDTLELRDFPDIYSKFIQSFISICQILPAEAQRIILGALSSDLQHTVISELSRRSLTSEYNSQFPATPGIEEDDGDLLNIKDMDRDQILRAVFQRRIEQYRTHEAAAESLGIDPRTLRRYIK